MMHYEYGRPFAWLPDDQRQALIDILTPILEEKIRVRMKNDIRSEVDRALDEMSHAMQKSAVTHQLAA